MYESNRTNYSYVGKQITDVKLWLLYSNTWNNLTVFKKRAQARLRMLSTKYIHQSHIYLINIYKGNLALNNQQWLLYHKTQPNQSNGFLRMDTLIWATSKNLHLSALNRRWVPFRQLPKSDGRQRRDGDDIESILTVRLDDDIDVDDICFKRKLTFIKRF